MINGGGLINVSQEMVEEGYNPRIPREKTHNIYHNILTIFEIAEKKNISINQAAISLAEYRIKAGIGKRFGDPHFHCVE